MTTYICRQCKESQPIHDLSCKLSPCLLIIPCGSPPPKQCPYNNALTLCNWEMVE